MIAGQSPRIEWKVNPGGQVRSLTEAIAIARTNGVEVPDDVHFSIDELGDLGPERTACGPRVDQPEGTIVEWSSLSGKESS